jgi:hypothetical protein
MCTKFRVLGNIDQSLDAVSEEEDMQSPIISGAKEGNNVCSSTLGLYRIILLPVTLITALSCVSVSALVGVGE